MQNKYKSVYSCRHQPKPKPKPKPKPANLPCRGRSSPAWILSCREPPAIALAFFLSVMIWMQRETGNESVNTNPSKKNTSNASDIFNINHNNSGFYQPTSSQFPSLSNSVFRPWAAPIRMFCSWARLYNMRHLDHEGQEGGQNPPSAPLSLHKRPSQEPLVDWMEISS